MACLFRPLFPRRQGDRQHGRDVSEFLQSLLSIPENPRGRVRLEVMIPHVDLKAGLFIITVALLWPKGVRLPPSDQVAQATWARVVSGTPRRSRTGFLAFEGPNIGTWKATTYITHEARTWLPLIPAYWAMSVLEDALVWAEFLLMGKWPSDSDRWRWIYRQHQRIALLVADEVVTSYLQKSPLLHHRDPLEEAWPILTQRIKASCPLRHNGSPPVVTARRVALALVDVKFEQVLPRLLDPSRAVGLTDGKLWARILPPRIRETLLTLCPTTTIAELQQLPKEAFRENTFCDWFGRWWGLLVYLPLRSFTAAHFMSIPGIEDLAARVWGGLHRS